MSEIPATIGPYQVVREIGRGGMGVVYLGHDARLDRPVAIKILPEAMAHDPERIARLTREARTLATVNHTGVASIYGVEESPAADGSPSGAARFVLILEYVPGETLGERLAAGPLAVEDALSICAQVAAAVEAAHEKGVIHRDLKPDNIKITPEGDVKVLDFGLAKADRTGSSTSMDATVRADSPGVVASRIGEVLGTPGYMSPEQCRGRSLDKRTDIWSLGCIMYECLCGLGPFRGETANDSIAAILEREPDWARLPARTPPRIRELLVKCLAKDARNRLRDIGDAKLELERALTAREWSGIASFPPGMMPPTTNGHRDALRLIGAGLAGVVLASIAWMALRGSAPTPTDSAAKSVVTRVSVDAPENVVLWGGGIGPDGRTIFMDGDTKPVAGGPPVTFQTYTRDLESFTTTPFPQSVGMTDGCCSPDGRFLALLVPASPGSNRQRIIKGPVDGSSPPVTVIELPDNTRTESIAWPEGDDMFAVQRGTRGVLRISIKTGAISQPIITKTPGANGFIKRMRPLVGNTHFLVDCSAYGERGFDQTVGVLDIATGEVRTIISNASCAKYVPTGHLLFARSDALLAVPFDLKTLSVTGGPVALMNGLRTDDNWSNASFSISNDGTLAYLPGGVQGTRRTLVTVDLDGKIEPWLADQRAYSLVLPPCVSPDESRAAVVITNANGIDEIWIADPARKLLRRLVALPHADVAPMGWMPDGERLIFSRVGDPASEDGVYLVRTDGSEAPELLIAGPGRRMRHDVGAPLPDGSGVIVDMLVDGRSDLVLVPVHDAAGSAPAAPPRTLVRGAPIFAGAAVSSDGRLLAYAAPDLASRQIEQVYVCALTPDGETGPRIQASIEGGFNPRWRSGSDGKLELQFIDSHGRGRSAVVTTEPRIRVEQATLIADASAMNLLDPGVARILADGRLLAVQPGEEEYQPRSVWLVFNFLEELKRKMAEAGPGR